jgi:DNA-binding transcriptional MerR regulator
MENGEQRDFSISELADEAGVSTRTIRYYVSEGLLPPPVGAGPNSRYTDAHLAQLAIIGQLKEQYLPLKEIRRRLIGHNMPDAGHSREADVNRSQPPAAAPIMQKQAINSDAEPETHRRLFSRRGEIDTRNMTHQFYLENVLGRDLVPGEPIVRWEDKPENPVPTKPEINWRRIAITDDAELVITEDQYTRHQDKIDWLVQWASRVLE